MKHSKKNPQMRTLLYIISVGLIFAGVFTLPFLDSYFFISVVAIVAGCVLLVFIPTKSKKS